MKKFTNWSIVFCAASIMLMSLHGMGQAKDNDFGPVSILMEKSLEADNLPGIISDPAFNRGAAFNGQYVFVASRQGGNNVYYWDVNDPDAEAQTLDMTGIAGGTFTINDLTVVGNHIFLSNMVFASGTFKVYHWNGVDAAPSVFIEYENSPDRLGDAISIVGDPVDGGVFIASAHGGTDFYTWPMSNGAVVDQEPDIMPFEANDEMLNFSRVTGIPQAEQEYYLISGPFFGPILIDDEAFFVEDIDLGFFPAWPMYAHVFFHEGHRMLAYMHVKGDPQDEENVLYILDLSDGETTPEAMANLEEADFADKVLYSAMLGNAYNGNASVSVDLHIDGAGNVQILGYAAGNGLVLIQIGDEEEEEPDFLTLPFVENFEREDGQTNPDWLPEGWMVIDADGDGHNWQWDEFEEDDYYEAHMVSYSWLSDTDEALTPDNWLITPKLYLGEAGEEQSIELKYFITSIASGPQFRPERYEVLISTTDNDPDSFDMIYEEVMSEEIENWEWQEKVLDLTSYAGETVYIAFRHYGTTDLWGIAIESVEVKLVGEEDPEELIYSISLQLAEGTYHYKYFVVFDGPSWDYGEWPGDPNREIEVTGEVTVNDIWGDQPGDNGNGNGNGEKENTKYIVTFKVDMTGVVIGEGEDAVEFDPEVHHVFIAGGFGGDIDWNQPGSNPDLEMTLGDTGVVSVPEIAAQSQVNLFPNPAQSQFTVAAEHRIEQVMISDLTGRVISSHRASDSQFTINISDLSNGIYLVSVYTEDGVTVSKLQIQK